MARSFLAVMGVAALASALLIAQPTMSHAVSTGTVSGLHVAGNQLENAGDQRVQLQGVVLSEFEYACTDYHGLYAASSYPALRAWHVNAVKIPINPDFWQSCGGAYQQAEYAAIDTALAQGMYVLLTSQASQGGAEPAPTTATLTMWQAVAARYRGQGAVLYETFSEPHGPEDNNGSLWVNGGQGYVGQNQIVATIQAADPGALVFPNSPEYGGVAGKYVAEGWHVANAAGYSLHLYDNGGNANAANWPGNFGTLAQSMPIIAGEFGSNTGSCDPGFLKQLLGDMTSHIAGWFAWEWNPDSANYCGRPALLIDSNASLASGAPSPYGQPIHDYYGADGIGTGPTGGLPPVAAPPVVPPPTVVTPPTTTPTTPGDCTRWYTVVRGDTLSAIAARYGTTVANLAAWNQIANPNLIFPDQRFCVANGATTALIVPIVPAPQSPDGCIYTVVRGDTLSAIAARLGTTWAALAGLNSLPNPNLIFPGQHLAVCGHAAGTATVSYVTPTAGGAVNHGAFGECVWYVQSQRMDIQLRGDAWQLTANAAHDGYRTGTTPAINAIAVFAPGVDGASGLGHTGIVVAYNATMMEVREMNVYGVPGGGFDRVDTRWVVWNIPGVTFIYGR